MKRPKPTMNLSKYCLCSQGAPKTILNTSESHNVALDNMFCHYIELCYCCLFWLNPTLSPGAVNPPNAPNLQLKIAPNSCEIYSSLRLLKLVSKFLNERLYSRTIFKSISSSVGTCGLCFERLTNILALFFCYLFFDNNKREYRQPYPLLCSNLLVHLLYWKNEFLLTSDEIKSLCTIYTCMPLLCHRIKKKLSKQMNYCSF